MLRHMLQRGLGIAAEDRRVPLDLRRELVVASTGPRHRCRGSVAVEYDTTAPQDKLQRGLGIAAEDRRPVHTCRMPMG